MMPTYNIRLSVFPFQKNSQPNRFYVHRLSNKRLIVHHRIESLSAFPSRNMDTASVFPPFTELSRSVILLTCLNRRNNRISSPNTTSCLPTSFSALYHRQADTSIKSYQTHFVLQPISFRHHSVKILYHSPSPSTDPEPFPQSTDPDP